MNLCVDIGNTQVKLGIFDNDEMLDVFTQEDSIDEILLRFKIKNAILSKTGSSELVEFKLEQKKKINTVFLSHQLKLPIKILYETPHTLGADRIAGSAAANFLFPQKNILKIDFSYNTYLHHRGAAR